MIVIEPPALAPPPVFEPAVIVIGPPIPVELPPWILNVPGVPDTDVPVETVSPPDEVPVDAPDEIVIAPVAAPDVPDEIVRAPVAAPETSALEITIVPEVVLVPEVIAIPLPTLSGAIVGGLEVVPRLIPFLTF